MHKKKGEKHLAGVELPGRDFRAREQFVDGKEALVAARGGHAVGGGLDRK